MRANAARHAAVAFLAGALGIVGCDGKTSVSPLLGSTQDASDRLCIPGASIECVGAGGCIGGQACLADGLAYGTCACSVASRDGGGRDAGRDGTTGFSSDSGREGGSGFDARPGSDAGVDAVTPTFDANAPCPYSATDLVDHDGDGWSPAQGDCNDCNKYVNPGAYDVPGDGIDQDCDGKPDDEPTGCDSMLTGPATTTGTEGAQAIDLCRTAQEGALPPVKTWGVISADYVLPDGSNAPVADADDGNSTVYTCTYDASSFLLGLGVLGPTFGTSNDTRQGVRMLGLSTGTARQPTDSGYVASNDTGGSATAGSGYPGFDKCYTSGAPAGFPAQTPACPGVTFGTPHDGAALRLVVRVPTNALTMSFDTNFFSYEFPNFVCSTYNDTFVVIMTPSPAGEPSSASDNIVFDSMGNVLSVNAASLLTVCDANTAAGGATYPCAEGPAKLTATGFGKDTTATALNGDSLDHASSDWLTTTVSVGALAGQEVTLLFAVWDSSDGVYDTTVLVDNVRWTFATAPNATVSAASPMTVPAP